MQKRQIEIEKYDTNLPNSTVFNATSQYNDWMDTYRSHKSLEKKSIIVRHLLFCIQNTDKLNKNKLFVI